MKTILEARRTRELGPLNPFPFVVANYITIGWTICKSVIYVYGCLTRNHFIFWAFSYLSIIRLLAFHY
jgi:hypothetical protein